MDWERFNSRANNLVNGCHQPSPEQVSRAINLQEELDNIFHILGVHDEQSLRHILEQSRSNPSIISTLLTELSGLYQEHGYDALIALDLSCFTKKGGLRPRQFSRNLRKLRNGSGKQHQNGHY